MARITTIVHFEVPDENKGTFLSVWQKAGEQMVRQPGIVDGVFRRRIDEDAPFQFINVARWEGAEALASGLRATAEALGREGISLPEAFQELGVKVTQNNYLVEADYAEELRN